MRTTLCACVPVCVPEMCNTYLYVCRCRCIPTFWRKNKLFVGTGSYMGSIDAPIRMPHDGVEVWFGDPWHKDPPCYVRDVKYRVVSSYHSCVLAWSSSMMVVHSRIHSLVVACLRPGRCRHASRGCAVNCARVALKNLLFCPCVVVHVLCAASAFYDIATSLDYDEIFAQA